MVHSSAKINYTSTHNYVYRYNYNKFIDTAIMLYYLST